jgi:hypothetical protein
VASSDPLHNKVLALLELEERRRTAGKVDEEHYTTLLPAIKVALSSRDLDEAAGLLLRAVAAVEREAEHIAPGAFVPPWFHKKLASVYRRVNMKEAATSLLERYERLAADVETKGRAELARLRGP